MQTQKKSLINTGMTVWHWIVLCCCGVPWAQCSAMQCSAVPCSAVPCSAVQCRAVSCSAVQCSAVCTSGLLKSTTLIDSAAVTIALLRHGELDSLCVVVAAVVVVSNDVRSWHDDDIFKLIVPSELLRLCPLSLSFLHRQTDRQTDRPLHCHCWLNLNHTHRQTDTHTQTDTDTLTGTRCLSERTCSNNEHTSRLNTS